VLYELAHRREPNATEIAKDLALDMGYLSRILQNFQKDGLIARESSAIDRRRNHIMLTTKGRQAFRPLDRSAGAAVSSMLLGLGAPAQERLVAAMRTIERLLDPLTTEAREFTLRGHRPGDIGWVIQRHGELYSQEYGWGESFEALVAEIAAKFIQEFDPARERCWIAERDGERAGSIFLVKQSHEVAKLRLLLVEPWARGGGLGKRLVAECVAFARAAGYRTMTLWTQDLLLAARRIYQTAGFRLVREEPHAHFGIEMTGQIWELQLQ
jgi:DNA-binding MarR family transcriptional regulator/N-acetylglutamate synthase-like GNAT family acetyltransferase